MVLIPICFFSNATKKLIQFWQYLPRASIIPHNSRARSHKSAPPHPRCQSEVQLPLFLICCVQWLGCVQLFAAPWTAAHQTSLSITNSKSFSNSWTHVHRVSDAIQLSHLVILFCLQSFPASVSLLMSQFFASGGQNVQSKIQDSFQVISCHCL